MDLLDRFGVVMLVSRKLYGWTDSEGRICISLFPADRPGRPFNIYPNKDAAYAEMRTRRDPITGDLAYSEIVWEDEQTGPGVRPTD